MIHVLPLVSRGKTCPRCGSRAERVHIPMLLRPIRLVLPTAVRRRCEGRCGWRGFALPGPPVQRSPQAEMEHEQQLTHV